MPNYSPRFRNRIRRSRTPTQKLVCFQLGHEHYAIPIGQVQRVLKDFTPYGSLPNGRSLVEYNGQVITVIDPATLLPGGLIIATDRENVVRPEDANLQTFPLDKITEIPGFPTLQKAPRNPFSTKPSPPTPALPHATYLIVCSLCEELIGLLVLEVPTILEVSEDKYEPLPHLYTLGPSGKPTPVGVKDEIAHQSRATSSSHLPIEKLIHTQEGKSVFYLNLEKLVSLVVGS